MSEKWEPLPGGGIRKVREELAPEIDEQQDGDDVLRADKRPPRSKEGDGTPASMSRRGFLKGAAAAGIAAAVPKELGRDEVPGPAPEVSPQPPERPEREHEAGPETFESRVAGYKAWWQLRHDEILFVDESGAPVGEPVPFQDFVVERDGEPYLLTPAEMTGWIRHVRKLHADKHGVPEEVLEQMNVNAVFDTALSNSDEPALIEGIKNGTINCNFDIVHYFGDKPVRGAEEYSRIEYVRERVEFTHPKMSDTIKHELHALLPAICAKESRFNDDLESPAGASGISQFMPSTVDGLTGYKEYVNYEPKTRKNEDSTEEIVRDENGEPVMVPDSLKQVPLIVQVEMMGEHFDNIYDEIRADGVEELMEEFILPLFTSREAFERDFVVPCMINAYNPGGGTMRVAIQRFLEANEPGEMLQRYRGNAGKELFFELSKFAEASDQEYLDAYQERSAEYAYYVYAAREVFDEEQQRQGS